MTKATTETISVVIPSYGRSDALVECLEGVAVQIPAPAEIVCVIREDDHGSHAVLSEVRLPVRTRVVSPPRPGLVAALQVGLETASSPLVAFVDDDAVPRPGWLEQIQIHFASDLRVAGVGGRDWVHYEGLIDEPRPRRTWLPWISKHGPKVGVLEWTGRVTDSHHGGIGPARDVDVLKGVNMAFRRHELLSVGFDPHLRGSGSQVHNEIWPCLQLRGRGLRLVYDPAVAVDHYIRSRPVGDEREYIRRTAIGDATFNETRAVLKYRSPAGGLLTLLWGVLVGTSLAPGLAHTAYLALRRTPEAGVRFSAAAGARIDAYRSLRADRRGVPMVR
jgi:GT2 family glycosyltransferase